MHGAKLGVQLDWANAPGSLFPGNAARVAWRPGRCGLQLSPPGSGKGRLLFVMPPPPDLRRRGTAMCDGIPAMRETVADELQLRALCRVGW